MPPLSCSDSTPQVPYLQGVQPWNSLIRKVATAPAVGASFRQDLSAQLAEKLQGMATIRRVHIGGRDRAQVTHCHGSQIDCASMPYQNLSGVPCMGGS